MGPVNNNKEFFELLDGTDSNSSEIQNLVIPPRKKRFRRRLRNNPSIRHDGGDVGALCSHSARMVSVSLLFVLVVTWLVSITWLAAVLHSQVTRLNEDLQKLVAAHQGVPDALHACHSLSRELHKNQTEIISKLSEITVLQRNLTQNMTRFQDALYGVQQQLNASPSLLRDPQLVNDLSKQVAEFGSKIQDLQATAVSLKEQESKHEGILTTIGSNVTDLYAQVVGLASDRGGVSLSQLTDAKAFLMAKFSELVANVTKLNDTLASKLEWTHEDQSKDHKTVVSLQEMDQNITARLRTLEDIYLKSASTSSPQLQSEGIVAPTEQHPTSGATSGQPSLEQLNPFASVDTKVKDNVPPPLQPHPSERP